MVIASMTDLIEAILGIFSSDFINAIVLLSIVVIFITASFFSKENRAPEFVQYTPTLLTSLGVFGTFFGIVLGLLHFNPNDIDGSLPLLLDGVKSAFITSLVGMFGALLFKSLQLTPLLDSKYIVKDGGSGLGESMLSGIEQQTEELRSLNQSLTIDDETTLFGQLKLLRVEMNKNSIQSLTKREQQLDLISEKICLNMTDFADTLSTSATAQVVDALQKVVVSFNRQLSTQFGENFVQFNDAVKSLLAWQENYKTQLEKMNQQYAKGVQAISATEVSITQIGGQSRIILENMNALKEVMVVNRHQIAELERHLGAFKDIRDRAVEAVPEIRSQVEFTVAEISASVTCASTHYQQLLTNSNVFIKQHAQTTENLLTRFAISSEENIQKVGLRLENSAKQMGKEFEIASSAFTENTGRTNEGIQNMSKYLESQTVVMSHQLQEMVGGLNQQVRDILGCMVEGSKTINESMSEANSNLLSDTKVVRDQVIETIDSMQTQLKDVIEHVSSEQHRLSISTFKSLEKKIANQVEKTGEVLEKQVGLLDQVMQEEINNAFTDMGTQLIKLTGRFTEDYGKLTSQMQSVVNRASGL